MVISLKIAEAGLGSLHLRGFNSLSELLLLARLLVAASGFL